MDYLTSANYGDGLSNATPTWTYDAAGNRVSDSTNSGTWSYDNLNRMTASPGKVYSNDILGNRLSAGVGNTNDTMTSWDDLNRLTQLSITSNNINTYVYRADGLRVSKSATGASSSQSSTLYRYDGQMGIEDIELNSSSTITAITRNALGARGIDAISRTTSSGTSVAYPLYDAHGNNVGMLTKSGSSWSLGDERTYDAWGQVRSGSTTGDQKGRYCANLGHKQDDESGLVYMRARYYEPTSGRFISEDSNHQGKNFFAYCENNPVSRIDKSGNSWDPATKSIVEFAAFLWSIASMIAGGATSRAGLVVAIAGFALLEAWIGTDAQGYDINCDHIKRFKNFASILALHVVIAAASMTAQVAVEGVSMTPKSICAEIIGMALSYNGVLSCMLAYELMMP